MTEPADLLGRQPRITAPRHRRAGLSIQSLLLIMMLVVSILSNVVIGVIGYVNGTDSLRDAASARVTEVRDARARGIADLFETIKNSMLVHSRGESVIGAASAFTDGFAALEAGGPEAAISDELSAALDAYYTDVLGPRLDEAVGEPVDVTAFAPTGTAQRYLQALYTAPAEDFDDAIAVDDAGDGSAWSAAHARYHDYFRRMVEQLDYQDILLIDLDGNVVYSAYKGIDLGTNLTSGPYAHSNLAGAYRTVLAERTLDSVVFTDYETYRPSIDLPAAWGVGLISREGEVIAKVDTAEAFAPVNDFTTKLLISSAIMVVLVSILSLILAQVIVRPLKRLQVAAEQIAAGEEGVEVDGGNADELVAVANAFNDMSRALSVKNDLLDAQRKENERLLRSFMPETLAQRYKEGETNIALDHPDAGVVYADIVGFEAYSRDLDSEHELAVLNALVKQFDDAAERFGVERVRTTRQGYLASCGLTVPRIDAARRIVEFAHELTLIIDRHNGQNGTELALRAGIDLGVVTSGLIGQQHIAFDLWGEAAQTAVRVQSLANDEGVYLTDHVRERLGDVGEFVEVGRIHAEGENLTVWKLVRI